jgi:hypothetical protein
VGAKVAGALQVPEKKTLALTMRLRLARGRLPIARPQSLDGAQVIESPCVRSCRTSATCRHEKDGPRSQEALQDHINPGRERHNTHGIKDLTATLGAVASVADVPYLSGVMHQISCIDAAAALPSSQGPGVAG